jgi:hypothetical protein
MFLYAWFGMNVLETDAFALLEEIKEI